MREDLEQVNKRDEIWSPPQHHTATTGGSACSRGTLGEERGRDPTERERRGRERGVREEERKGKEKLDG
ncbi:hypothetical protein DY000_02041373 [Brassica cretica]|uniref:Uncharacterized protein n=1 Tax=Brassica cretica TaxID=69181 RepID=A0ABQ7BJI9_BRACR|nr:hypothetical protein DY000_02041373 [Brassica cretica]